MKDKSIYIILFLILIVALIFIALYISNENLVKINEELKRENYNLKSDSFTGIDFTSFPTFLLFCEVYEKYY